MAYSYQAAGWSAVASALAGLVAYGCLIGAVVGRGSGALSQPQYVLMFDLHDVASILQFLLMAPVVCALFKLSRQQGGGMSPGSLRTGLVSVYLVALALALDLPRLISNGIYMLPQGLFGVWLIHTSWRFGAVLPRAVRWLGLAVGLGLLLFSFFLIGYTLFVSPIHLRIPAATIEEFEAVPFNSANVVLHQFIWIGSIMGVLLLPFWSLLMGRRLLRSEAGSGR